PRARTGARDRQSARARAGQAQGSPHGGQFVGTRRQGSRYGLALSRKQSAMNGRGETGRIDRRFAALSKLGRAALVTFTMAGDPHYASTLPILKPLPIPRSD